MVLKKSNSCLNSGATQHVMRGGFVDPSSRFQHGSLYGFIEISVEIPSIEVTEEVDAYLGQINEYLDFSLPKFCNVSSRWWNRKSLVSYDKGGNWLLKQRIDALMNDIDFLKKVSRTIDIDFTEISKNLASARYGSSSRTKTSSQILKAFESEEQEREKARLVKEGAKSRKRQTYHGRGVQRRHNSRSNEELERNVNQQEEESPKERKATLTFTFHKPCAVDARASKFCEQNPFSYEIYHRHGLKSFRKRKGYVNGARSENRELSYNLIKDTEDLQVMDHRVLKTDKLSIIDLEADEEFSDPSYTFSLEDFIPKQNAIKRKHTLCNHKKDRIACKEATICDNTDKPKHPKGSYIFINPDSDSSLCESSWEVIKSSRYQSLVANDWENQTDLVNNGVDMTNLKDSQETPNEVLLRPEMNSVQDVIQGQEKASESFIESFISVQALMPGDGISLFPETLDKLHLDGRSNVTIGDSLPHCFCISPLNHVNKSYIVARRASRNGKTWLFSFQGSCAFQRENFRNRFSRLHQFGEHLSLTQVITVGEEILNGDADSQELTEMNIGVTSCTKPKNSELDLWVELANKFRQEVSIHTAEEATEKIRISLTQSKKPGRRSEQVCPKISEDIECGVCFSPCNLYGKSDNESAMMLMSCGHLHCVICWRAHVYHSINSGAPRISCMTSGCNTILDETTIKTLAPSSMVDSWQARLTDRFLQSSNYTSWCPDGRCGNVAMSNGTPLKKQFGSPLICNCLRSWCSNCQEDPHWPASCDQISVYKKLLSKTGKESHVPVAHASFSIDVKKCPKCKYPIEKFQGCPSMVCRMCWFNFCWNCLQSTEKHNVYSCKAAPTSHSVTFQLNNKLVYDLPIKYFLESVQANKQRCLLRQKRSWLQKLRRTSEFKFSLHRRQFSRNLSMCSSDAGVNSTFELIDEVLVFMKGAFTQIELFYVLLGFVQLNKTKPAVRLIAAANSKLSRLHFVVDRLSSHVFGRSLSHISAISKQARILLRTGATTLEEMFALAPQLQHVSKDVETAWVGNVDPSKHLRYM